MIYLTEPTLKHLIILKDSTKPLTQSQMQIMIHGQITPSTRVTTHIITKKLHKHGLIEKTNRHEYKITPQGTHVLTEKCSPCSTLFTKHP